MSPPPMPLCSPHLQADVSRVVRVDAAAKVLCIFASPEVSGSSSCALHDLVCCTASDAQQGSILLQSASR